MSMHSFWANLIWTEHKKIEVRKNLPKDFIKPFIPFKVLIYETKSPCYKNSGKVTGEFYCLGYKTYLYNKNKGYYENFTEYEVCKEPEEARYYEACLTKEKFEEYGKEKPLYGLIIDCVKVYDKPKDLSEFGLKRAPQSWCYVEEK